MAVNGWVVGRLVRKLTGSWAWAALGVVLVTWNFSTAFRLQGHAHLFKYGWTVLAVAAFSRYLDRPKIRRGIVLGLAMALVLQGSFYLGAFLGMACAAWWLGCLAAGSLSRRHLSGAVAALSCFTVLGLAFTFPVWSPSRTKLLTDAYGGHGRIDAWKLSAELWQYLLPPDSKFAASYLEEFQRAIPRGKADDGRLELPRPDRPPLDRDLPALPPPRAAATGFGSMLLDRFMGLTGVLVLFSLAGDRPSSWPRGSVASGPTAAPGCWPWPSGASPRRDPPGRAAVSPGGPASLPGVALPDGTCLVRGASRDDLVSLGRPDGGPRVGRLAVPAARGRSPRRVPPAREHLADWWGYDSLLYRAKHRHASLNGSDSLLFEADLKLLGAVYERMNPAGLRLVASLGYDHLAFHREYLESNPWIASLPWLEKLETRGPWTFHRVTPRLERFPIMPLDEVLASWEESSAPVEVPPIPGSPTGSWSRRTWSSARRDPSGSAGQTCGADSSTGRHRPSTSTSSGRASRPSPRRRRRNPANTGWPSSTSRSGRYDPDPTGSAVISRRSSVGRHPGRTRRCRETRHDAGRQARWNSPIDPREHKPLLPPGEYEPGPGLLEVPRNHAGTMRTSAGSLVLSVRDRPRGESPTDGPCTILLPCDLPIGGRIELPLRSIDTSVNEPLASVDPFFTSFARVSRPATSLRRRPGWPGAERTPGTEAVSRRGANGRGRPTVILVRPPSGTRARTPSWCRVSQRTAVPG